MNFPWLRNSVLGLSLLLVFGSEAPAQMLYGISTAYVVPTSYYPTAYIYPTAAYAYPTSYAATSYDLTPTSYLVPAVSYRRSFLFPWRYVARPAYTTALAYTPTAYYAPTMYSPTVYSPTVYSPTVYSPTVYATSYSPTVLDYPVIASSTVYCAEATTVAAAPARRPQPAPPPSENDERAPSSAAESVPSNVPPYDNSANPGAATGGYIPRTGSGAPPAAAPRPDPGTESPPAVPTYQVPPEPKPGTAGAPTREVNSDLPPPAAIPPPEPGPASYRREVKKPVAVTPGSSGRISNILEGKVVSGDTRQTEEGVRITVANRLGKFENRVATTDAYGRYAVRLPDGDWTVNVEMPSGRVYPVSQITISGGQIVDTYGREIPSLTITR